jgi:hypothetical protein
MFRNPRPRADVTEFLIFGHIGTEKVERTLYHTLNAA